VHLREVLAGQAAQPARRQEADALQGLRLSIRSLRPPTSPSSAATAIAAGLLSGLLLNLANPPADAGPLAFVALVPLLWALRGGRPRRGAAAAFAFGVVYYGFLLDW